jgi:hypothetical protein
MRKGTSATSIVFISYCAARKSREIKYRRINKVGYGILHIGASAKRKSSQLRKGPAAK